MLKRIARKILQAEIEVFEKKIRNIQLEKSDLEDLKSKEIIACMEETKKALEEKCKLEKENKILRKYYNLDKDPSDEIKIKIHIDLEINRLKEENQKLAVMANKQPPFIPFPMPYYSPFERF